MEKELPNIEGRIEALLFLYGEPVKTKKLAETLGIREKSAEEHLEILENKLRGVDRGLALIRSGDKVQLVTKPDLKDILKKAVNDDLDTTLSPASMETLAIIAYLGPCRRALIDHIRGVNSSFILRSLLVRGLIERKQDKEKANAFAYQITFDFLGHMGLDKKESLPDYEKYKNFATLFTENNTSDASGEKEGDNKNENDGGENESDD